MDKLIEELISRLPELEWQLSKLDSIEPKHLPSGLFHQPVSAPLCSYVNEIRLDINRIDSFINYKRLHYLVSLINQKIHVLVALCKQPKKQKFYAKTNGLRLLTSQQAWLRALENEIQNLSLQHQALTQSMTSIKEGSCQEKKLSLQKELSQIEHQLSLTKEKYIKSL